MELFALEMKFVSAPAEVDWKQDDPDFFESAIEAYISGIKDGAWEKGKTGFESAFVPRENNASGAFSSPGFAVQSFQVATLATGGLPVLAGLLGAWMQARYGRKVRLKIGDIEAEAGSAEEVERLLERARVFQSPGKAP